jgi:hypothetical protein
VGAGHVIGRWRTDLGRPEAGVLPCIYVTGLDDTLRSAAEHGAAGALVAFPATVLTSRRSSSSEGKRDRQHRVPAGCLAGHFGAGHSGAHDRAAVLTRQSSMP